MDEKFIQKMLQDKKMMIDIMLSICVFIGTGLYFLTPFREWEQIKLDTHNFYLSVQLPRTCKVVEYSTVTKSGKPIIGSSFLDGENNNVEKFKIQLLEQKWEFSGEHTENEGAWKVYEYRKQGYSYRVVSKAEGGAEFLGSEK